MWSKAIYIAGMAVLGAGIGYFVTLSRSPVVGVLLPLLFSLIGGAGGVFLVREDLAQKAGQERLGILGASMVALVGAAILTSVLVFTLNTRTMTPELTEVQGYSTLAPSDQLAVLEMRLVATLFGATAKEKSQLLESAARKEPKPKISLDPPELVASRLDAMRPALESVAQQMDDEFISKTTDDQIKETLIQARAISQSSADLFRLWSLKKLANTTYGVVEQELDMVKYALSNTVGNGNGSPPAAFPAIAGKPQLLEALFNLKWAIEAQPLNLVAASSFQARELQSVLSSQGRIELLKLLAGDSARERPAGGAHTLADQIFERFSG